MKKGWQLIKFSIFKTIPVHKSLPKHDSQNQILRPGISLWETEQSQPWRTTIPVGEKVQTASICDVPKEHQNKNVMRYAWNLSTNSPLTIEEENLFVLAAQSALRTQLIPGLRDASLQWRIF